VNVLHGTKKLRASHIATGTSLPARAAGEARDRGRVLRTPKVHTEVNERMHATCFGGTALVLALWRQLDAARVIDGMVHVLRRHRPYHESDHILAQSLNLILGGTCLEDLSRLQHDPAILRMLGGDRVPDPTTSGDFLRRFGSQVNGGGLAALRRAGDELQVRVWKRIRAKRVRPSQEGRPRQGRRLVLLDLDSKIRTFTGNQKEGGDLSFKGTWSHHPLLLSCSTTQEVIAVRNRPGNVVSADGAVEMLREHLPRVKGGLGPPVVRMDAGFESAAIRGACEGEGAYFVQSAAGRHERYQALQAVTDDAWEPWLPPRERARNRKAASTCGRTRKKGQNVRRASLLRRFKYDKSKGERWLAEVQHCPTKSEGPCRLIIIREELFLQWSAKQPALFQHFEYRFIVSNLPPEYTPSDIVDLSYDRCDQEKMISQLGDDIPMWRMPVREFDANEASLEIARLAWNMGKWLGLLVLPVESIRWEWKRFRAAFIIVAAEVIRRGRQVWLRFSPEHRYVGMLRAAHAKLEA
jgi:hypothetical protein